VAERREIRRNWLALLPMVPVALFWAFQAYGRLDWMKEHAGVALIISAAVVLISGLVFADRTFHRRSIQGRILRARPQDVCPRCGYSSTGLDTEHVDSGTLHFDQAVCPECGRSNPR
jgi:ribosomal protein S27AE